MEEKLFIENLIKGNPSAYNALLNEYQQKFFATCISLDPNKEHAEDVVQFFLEVFKTIKKFKGNSKLSTWIYQLTTNKCLEFIRKKIRKRGLHICKPL